MRDDRPHGSWRRHHEIGDEAAGSITTRDVLILQGEVPIMLSMEDHPTLGQRSGDYVTAASNLEWQRSEISIQ